MSQPFVINREIVSVELSAIVTVEGTSNPSINLRENTLPNIKEYIEDFCQSILDWDVNYSTRTLAAPISIGGEHNWSIDFFGSILPGVEDMTWYAEMDEYYGKLDNVHDDGYQNLISTIHEFVVALTTKEYHEPGAQFSLSFTNDDAFDTPPSFTVGTRRVRT